MALTATEEVVVLPMLPVWRCCCADCAGAFSAALSERCVSAASWTEVASMNEFLNVCQPCWLMGFLPKCTILILTNAGDNRQRISSVMEQPA